MSNPTRMKTPPISAELLSEAETAFSAPILKPGFDRDAALWQAAQHDVIIWLKAKANITTAQPVSATGATIRMGS